MPPRIEPSERRLTLVTMPRSSRSRESALQLEITAKDVADPFRLMVIRHELFVMDIVPEGNRPTHAHAFLFGSGDLVPDAFARDLPLELSKGEQYIQREPPHGVRGVELLGDGNERHAMRIE